MAFLSRASWFRAGDMLSFSRVSISFLHAFVLFLLGKLQGSQSFNGLLAFDRILQNRLGVDDADLDFSKNESGQYDQGKDQKQIFFHGNLLLLIA